MPAVVISTEAVHVDSAILLEYLTSEVALEETEIASTDINIPIDNDFKDDKLHLRIPGGSRVDEDEGDNNYESDAIPTASWQRRAAPELERVDLGTSAVDQYQGDDGNNVDVYEEEDASQADNGPTQNVED